METAVSMHIRIVDSPDEFAHSAAELFRDSAQQAIDTQGRFSAALSGGTTPKSLFRLVGTSYRKKITWNKVHLFWSDERCVPRDHEQSNFRLAYDHMLSCIWIPAENVHRIKGELIPQEAAHYYEADMKRHFNNDLPDFDLILLGVGADGHTASLFPGSDSLRNRQRLALPVFSNSALQWRVTLTLPVLNNARQIVFLVSGKSKAAIVRELLMENKRADYPAGLVQQTQGSIIWLLDRDAASELPETLA